MPIRLTVVMSGLRCGGIERATVSLIGGLLERGYEVAVITFAAASTDFFSLPAGTRRLALGIATGRPTALPQLLPKTVRSLWSLRAAIRSTRPDIVISHAPQINVPTLFALRGQHLPVIVTEHGDVSTLGGAAGAWLWKKWLWYRLRRLCYASAARVVSVSEGVDRNLAWLPSQRRIVIHNAFASITRHAAPAVLPRGLAPQRPWIASMGRLSHAKGFDLLLGAFARIAARFPQWQLAIIGDGELLEELMRQAADLGLGDQVVFTGALADPFPLLQRAKLFVMASRFEGFPMAHGEALACGLPVVATDCPSRPQRWTQRAPAPGGVRELVRHDLDGLLVPCANPAALADAMAELMANPEKRERLARQAAQGAARFTVEGIVDQWDRLLREICGRT